MKVYTRKGDDGTTGLLYGGRIGKDDPAAEAYGTVDEAVSVLGLARAIADGELGERLLRLQRDLFVVGAELATAPVNRAKLQEGVSLVTVEMVEQLEAWIDRVTDQVGLPTEFLVPGQTPLPAALDFARTVVRRAERRVVAHFGEAGIRSASGDSGAAPASYVVPYLNRMADYLYMMARAAEGEWQPSRER